MRAFLLTAAIVVALVVSARGAATSGLSSADRAKIEALITSIEQLADARFIRNGRSYGAATAAKFLRGKWEDRAADVRTVEDFIQQVATRSSTTGRPYLIRFKDGREIPSADFFRSRLAKL